MGARKMASPDINVKRLAAECTIFQGTMTHPAVIVISTTPLRMDMYLGNKLTRSLLGGIVGPKTDREGQGETYEALIQFAERLVPIWATHQQNPTKKAPQRPAGPSHWEASASGSQIYSS